MYTEETEMIGKRIWHELICLARLHSFLMSIGAQYIMTGSGFPKEMSAWWIGTGQYRSVIYLTITDTNTIRWLPGYTEDTISGSRTYYQKNGGLFYVTSN